MKNMLRSDSALTGAILGTILPALVFAILYAVGIALDHYSGKEEVLKLKTIGMISIFSNLITLRYYLSKLKFDRTGRGILAVTFIMSLVYFWFYI